MRRLALLGAACMLCGCVVGPNYRRPQVSAPPVFRGQEGRAEQASLADLPWWEVFHDEDLRALVREALARNNDLRAAAARVAEAREYVVEARSAYLPQVGYQSGSSGGRNEAFGNPIVADGERQGSLAVAFGAAWEVDVWGRIRRSNELALAQYFATGQARRGVMLSVVSEVARGYFELLGLDLRLEIARRNLRAFEETRNLFEERLKAGKASRLETARAQAAVAMTASAIPDLERQIAVQENSVRLLLGAAPGPIARKRTLLEQSLPPEVPAGLPSSLLERRPDVMEAESAVRAANARVGIATAAYFPTIGLTALLGRVSSPLDEFLWGRRSVWSTAAAAAGPIYSGSSLRARKRQAVALWEQARIRYEQTVLAAFRDVSNALVAREKLETVRALQARAVEAYREAVAVAQLRYAAGKSSYFEVLDAQLQLFPAENALAQTERDRRLVLVQLYRALGGGWKLADAAWSGP